MSCWVAEVDRLLGSQSEYDDIFSFAWPWEVLVSSLLYVLQGLLLAVNLLPCVFFLFFRFVCKYTSFEEIVLGFEGD
jgi:hypothetical protein